jgi:23S rRNA pseudouridine1911/1915/1917 synthase
MSSQDPIQVPSPRLSSLLSRFRQKPPTRSEDLSTDRYIVTHRVEESGLRLDSFLKDRYRKRSREALKRAIEEGLITIKREQSPHLTVGKLKPGMVLIPGDEISVLSEKKPEPEVSFDYKVIFEDETLLVIDKPSNLPVHPAGRYFFNTLLVHLRTQAHKNPLYAEREFFLVHRIDKETSGILVLTKDRDVCTDLTRQFRERGTEKTYLAIVKGITPEEFTVDLPLRNARATIELKMTTSTHEALAAQNLEMAARGPRQALEAAEIQDALTRFKRLGVYSNGSASFSLVECYPKTGRQHQIRVHLDAVGHTIVGDKLYGLDESVALEFFERRNLSAEAMAKLILPRHALHAAGIRFTHPKTGEKVEFRSKLPAELQNFLDGLTPQTQASSARPAAPKAASFEDSPSCL